MSSLHQVAPATRRAGNVSAALRATPATLQNDPQTLRGLFARLSLQFGSAWQVVGLWRRRYRDRAELRSLSPRDIRDFCPRESEAEEEMNKPFWRA